MPKNPRRNSTIQTNASSSFEETAPWDRKAILSLGKLASARFPGWVHVGSCSRRQPLRISREPDSSTLTICKVHWLTTVTDGGGIRGYSALLIIRALMKAIGDLERTYAGRSAISDGPAKTSYHPLSPGVSATTDAASIDEQLESTKPVTDTSPWLPCHYFDYMAGTSTGGSESLSLIGTTC